jgi:hypothetical protein
MEEMPKTSGGKVDKRALPSPDGQSNEAQASYVEPRTEMERSIAAIWRELLNVEKVGLHDNFFEIGGYSLLVIQVQSRVREIHNKDLSTIELFQYPTVYMLAKFLNQDEPEQQPAQQSQDRAKIRREALEQRNQGKETL